MSVRDRQNFYIDTTGNLDANAQKLQIFTMQDVVLHTLKSWDSVHD